MLKVITKSDIELLINFYKSMSMFDEEFIRGLYDNLNDNIMLFGSVERGGIDSVLSISIINHNYYIDKILYSKYNEDLIKDLISFAVTELRKDERGLNVIYDNFPYDSVMNDIMMELGFKCNYLNLSCDASLEKRELINPNILLNDKSEDVLVFIYKRLIEDIKSNDLYLGINSLIPDIGTVRLENTNVAVMRDERKEVVGTLRFGVVSDSILLDSLYASDESIYGHLINLIKNLTNKRIEISISPSRVNIVKMLMNMGFKKLQTDYIFKLN